MSQRTLKILKFDCQHSECPTHENRQCVPTCVHDHTEGAKPDDPLTPVEILFVGWKPYTEDVDKHRAYTSKFANVVLRMLEIAGRPTTYAFTNFVKCRPTDIDGTKRDPGPGEVEACQENFFRDLARLKPKVLVLQGMEFRGLVAQWVPGQKPLLGRVFHDVPIAGRRYTVLVTESPRQVVDNTSMMQHMMDTIIKAVDIAALGDKSVYHPINWDVRPEIIYCDTIEKIRSMVDYLLHETTKKQNCAVDVETKNLNARYGNSLVTVQFCVDPRDRAWVVPYAYQHGPFEEEDLPEVKKLLKRLFTEKPGFANWLGHNIGFEQLQAMEFITDGVTFKNVPMVDTMGEAYAMDENRVEINKIIHQGLSLKDLQAEMCGRTPYAEAALEARSAGELYKLPPWPVLDERGNETSPGLVPYAAEDVIGTQLIHRYMRKVAKAQGYVEKLDSLMANLYSGVYRLFPKMKRNGFFVDLDHLRLLSSNDSPILQRMQSIKEELARFDSAKAANRAIVAKESGGQIGLFGSTWALDINKPLHRSVWFFDTMKLEPIKSKKVRKTDKNAIDRAFYDKYSAKYPEIKLLQEYVGLRKLATSYTAKVIKYVDPSYTDHDDPKFSNVDTSTDSRVRPTFGFTNTSTGRPSCENPSTQNVPRADDDEKVSALKAKSSVKSMYAAQQTNGRAWRPGDRVTRVLMQLDYMAAEVRWLALLSGDKVLAEALRRGKLARDTYRKNPTEENKKAAELSGDIHRQTAALMFGVPIEEVDKPMRQKTKAITFALIYGGGPSLVAARIGSDDIEYVRGLCDDFAAAIPTGTRWLKEMESFAFEHMYVESPIGRRRRLLQYLTDRNDEHASANRLARNAPIQGIASDACLIGASIWNDWIEDAGKDWKIVNIVHDSCVTEIPLEDLDEAMVQAEKCFTVRMMNRMSEVWGLKFICPLEVEFDVGVRWGDMLKLDFSPDNLAHVKDWLRAGGLNAKH